MKISIDGTGHRFMHKIRKDHTIITMCYAGEDAYESLARVLKLIKESQKKDRGRYGSKIDTNVQNWEYVGPEKIRSSSKGTK